LNGLLEKLRINFLDNGYHNSSNTVSSTISLLKKKCQIQRTNPQLFEMKFRKNVLFL